MNAGERYGTQGLSPREKSMQQDQQAIDPWEERKDPKKVDLGEGEVFTGVLALIERVPVGNPPKMAVRYTFHELESGESYFMIGTYQIDSKLRRSDLGHLVQIRFEGIDQNVGRNGNQMRRYGVKVSRAPAPGWAGDGTPITDEDLPASAFIA